MAGLDKLYDSLVLSSLRDLSDWRSRGIRGLRIATLATFRHEPVR
jgi:hypothetical protein